MFKRIFCMMSVGLITLSCIGAPAKAESIEDIAEVPFVERATGRFSLDIPANKTIGATTSFPLEAGEKVTIRATYSPESASVDFGLIAPDGLFYPVRASGGSFEHSIRVDQHGNYTLAIRNNSNVEIAVSGIVNY